MKFNWSHKWSCSSASLITALLLWLISKNETVKQFWDKPVLIAFVFFFLVVIGYAIGAWSDEYTTKTSFIGDRR